MIELILIFTTVILVSAGLFVCLQRTPDVCRWQRDPDKQNNYFIGCGGVWKNLPKPDVCPQCGGVIKVVNNG